MLEGQGGLGGGAIGSRRAINTEGLESSMFTVNNVYVIDECVIYFCFYSTEQKKLSVT